MMVETPKLPGNGVLTKFEFTVHAFAVGELIVISNYWPG
jgi:hypothetical protein